LFSISAIWSSFPGNFQVFIVARFIGGLGIGFASMVCPVYIAEIAPPSWRGRLGALFQFGIVLGIFITLFINKTIQGMGSAEWGVAYGWRWMIGSEIIFCL
jgi:SP family arabinose:H+ symporter-like MFS transporter